MQGQRLMAVWKLQHREPYPQKPFLFYVAFCDQQVVDKLEESHIIHAGLEIAALPATHFRSGASWQTCQREQPELAIDIEAAPLAVALHGQVTQHESLDYLRDSLEVMASLVGHGSCAVYDPLLQRWYGARAWESMIEQGSLFNPFDHVAVLDVEDGKGTRWLRSQGLRKFGRPDLSARSVPEALRDDVRKMLDRFINHLALGGVLEEGREITLEGLPVYRSGPVQGGADDCDFRNSYVELRP